MVKTTYLVLFAVLLLFDVSLQSGITCRSGWELFEPIGKCYLFGRFKVNWFKAISLCKAFGGKLLETKSENELNTTVKKMIDYDKFFTDLCYVVEGVWTGANNILSYIGWRWLSSSDEIGPFKPWYDPNPSNTEGVEHCVEIRAADGYRWNDIDCDVENVFVCEKSPDPGE